MNKTKIYLQYPWKFPDSPYYKYLLDSLPDGVSYVNTGKQRGAMTNKKFFYLSNFLKKHIRKLMRTVMPQALNAHLSPDGDYDLIHCAHCLSKNKGTPWIFDIEAFWQLWISTKITKRGIERVRRIIMRDNCKKILPWTEKVREELVKAFPEVKKKIEVVYPAVPLKVKSKKITNEITLLFSARYFYWKGGLHALEAMDRLTNKYGNVCGVIVSSVPDEIKKKYFENKKIKFYDILPQEKLFEISKKADIFLYPGYTDSFGFGYLEAMSFGLPIVTVDGWSRREIVEEGKTGFVIERPKSFEWDKIGKTESKIIEGLARKTEMLIENKKLLQKMSGNCIKEISNGKFSIRERNKKLKRIYGEALGAG
jgi:glycosyltransferase involved in cell wall biosynthesis